MGPAVYSPARPIAGRAEWCPMSLRGRAPGLVLQWSVVLQASMRCWFVFS